MIDEKKKKKEWERGDSLSISLGFYQKAESLTLLKESNKLSYRDFAILPL